MIKTEEAAVIVEGEAVVMEGEGEAVIVVEEEAAVVVEAIVVEEDREGRGMCGSGKQTWIYPQYCLNLALRVTYLVPRTMPLAYEAHWNAFCCF